MPVVQGRLRSVTVPVGPRLNLPLSTFADLYRVLEVYSLPTIIGEGLLSVPFVSITIIQIAETRLFYGGQWSRQYGTNLPLPLVLRLLPMILSDRFFENCSFRLCWSRALL